MSDDEYEAMIHDTLNPDEYMRIRWDLPTMPSFADGDMCTTRAVVAIGVSDAPIYLDLTGIAKLRAVLDEAEAAFRQRETVRMSLLSKEQGTQVWTKALTPPSFDILKEVAAHASAEMTKAILGSPLTQGSATATTSTTQDMSAAIDWAREQYAQGKRKLLIVHREVPMPSPAWRHPDDVALRQGVGLVVAECCYGVTYKLIGYMRDDMEAAFCCAGVPLDVARHVARLVPTWTQEGRVNR